MAPSTDEAPPPVPVSQRFESFRADAKGFVEFMKELKDVRNGPFLCDPQDMEASLRPLVIACLEDYPQNITAAFERALWEKAFAPETYGNLFTKEAANFLDVASSQLGTHTAKIPNPAVSGPGGLFAASDVSEAAARLPFVSSFTTQGRLSIGAAGNAAKGRAWRFLSLRLELDGRIVDVAKDIAEKGPVHDAMIALGFEKAFLDEISEVLVKRFGGSDTPVPASLAKFLLWPTNSGDVVITPVHPYAMHVETFQRVKHRRSLDRDMRTASIKIGGTKPQNAGLVNSDLGGWHTHLMSLPPKTSDRNSRFLFAQSRASRVLFGRVGGSHPALRSFAAICSRSDLNNDGARQAIDRCLRSMTSLVLAPLTAFGDGEPPAASRALAPLPAPYAALVRKGVAAVSKDEREGVIEDVVKEVSSLPHGITFDDAMRRRARTVISSMIEARFNGATNA